jgi:2-polyprenyl-3-methyl-5-hydroxy-6-metoxy-1,4-benzoquinol methylase
VEQGAGVDALIEAIARLSSMPAKRFLEIGCGFGFSVDAGHKLFGWDAVGVDPSPLAHGGRTALNIDIRHTYADVDTDLGGAFDIVYASEVIEHVSDPAAFLRICKAHLNPGGVLVLTTPDGAYIRPDVSSAALFPILTPGHHLVIYNAESLTRVVRDAGFKHIQLIPRQHAVVLYASNEELKITVDKPFDRNLFLGYLEQTLDQTNLSEDLRTGLTYRLFKELVNLGRYNDALVQYDILEKDCKNRFGIALTPDQLPKLTDIIHAGRDSDKIDVPFCLAGIFFFRGMIELNHSENIGSAASWFDAASIAARAFRNIYQRFGIDDGETGMIEESAKELALLALCRENPSLAVDRLREMPVRDNDLIQRIVLQMIDLAQLEQAANAAQLTSNNPLAALVQGWQHLLAGRDVAAHKALNEAKTGGVALFDRARRVDMLALSSFSPDRAVTMGLELREELSIPLTPLFIRLVDHGHMAQAAAIEPSIDDKSWEVVSRRGLMKLLYDRDPKTAAELFSSAFSSAIGHTSENDLWLIKYRELLALVTSGDHFRAAKVAQEISNSINRAPKAILDLVDSLLQKHPLIRPSRL